MLVYILDALLKELFKMRRIGPKLNALINIKVRRHRGGKSSVNGKEPTMKNRRISLTAIY